MKTIPLFISLIFFNTMPLKAVLNSLFITTKDAKTVMILGEEHCDIELKRDAFVAIDENHHVKIMNTLKKIKFSNQKIAFLLEASFDTIMEYKEQTAKVAALRNPPYIGMHMQLPLFADSQDNNYGSIEFVYFDLRTKPHQTTIQFIINIQDILPLFKYTQSIGTSDFTTSVKNTALSQHGATIKKMTLNAMPECSVEEYNNNLDNLEKKINELDNTIVEKFLHYKEQAQIFFENHSKSHQDSLKEILWDVFSTQESEYFNETFLSWVLPFNSFLGTIGLQANIQKSLSTHDIVIAYCGQNHAFDLLGFLSEQNFTKEASAGLQTRISEPRKYFCTSEELNSIFNGLIEKLGVLPELHICTLCKSVEDRPQLYKHCGRCKKNHYCSHVCQKKDWETHKKICK